jgi:hypothetical protein
MSKSDFVVFVDESGDHSLSSIDQDWPVFVLSFCIFRISDYTHVVCPQIRSLKFETFGHDTVVLHESDIRRRRGAFSMLNQDAREVFLNKLTDIIEGSAMTLVAVVIDKVKLKGKYVSPAHPYYLAMQYGLERLYKFMLMNNQQTLTTCVVCEARGAKEDAALELEFRRVCSASAAGKPAYPFEIVIADKKTNSEGLQLADLTARPVGLKVLRPGQQNRAWDALCHKMFKGIGGATITGNGFKVFP